MFIDIEFEMDADGVRQGGADIVGLAARPGDIVVDLGQVTRLDSSGIGLLVHLQKRKQEGRWQFAITNVKGQPRELLDKLDLLSVWLAERPLEGTAPTRKPEPALQNG